MKPTRRVWLLALPVIGIAGLVAWSLWPDHNPVFHGKRESEWLNEASYSVNVPLPDEFVAQWRDFGPEGAEVLLRGLDRELGKANNPWIRLYRKITDALHPMSRSSQIQLSIRGLWYDIPSSSCCTFSTQICGWPHRRLRGR